MVLVQLLCLGCRLNSFKFYPRTSSIHNHVSGNLVLVIGAAIVVFAGLLSFFVLTSEKSIPGVIAPPHRMQLPTLGNRDPNHQNINKWKKLTYGDRDNETVRMKKRAKTKVYGK